jgi:hypothetical protein
LTTVQFSGNLKVTFSNQIQTPSGAGDQNGTPARQFVGAGFPSSPFRSGSMSWPSPMARTLSDVRNLTKKVSYFITPQPTADNPPKHIPPAVRFLWGSFQFDGIMESLEESLEFFSPDGRPLRASMSLALSQQKIKAFNVPSSERGRRPPPTRYRGDPNAAAGANPHRALRRHRSGLADAAGRVPTGRPSPPPTASKTRLSPRSTPDLNVPAASLRARPCPSPETGPTPARHHAAINLPTASLTTR